MVLVPMDTPGVKIVRPLSVFGYYDEPAGHCEVTFTNVKIPVTNILLGNGLHIIILIKRRGKRIRNCSRQIRSWKVRKFSENSENM
jgi:hypothetical protein